MSTLKITKNNFEAEVLKAEKPVLLDFWASWCGPCQMLGPVIEEIATEYKDKIIVGKVNVDDQPELASAFKVSSIPMVVVMQNGKVTQSSVGYQSKEKIAAMLP